MNPTEKETRSMKHKSVKMMMANPHSIDATDIANYAVMNTTDNDNIKTTNIVELIIAYSGTLNNTKK